MKRLSQIHYAIVSDNIIFTWTMRRRKKDCLADWKRESGCVWKQDKENGYRCVRLKVMEER